MKITQLTLDGDDMARAAEMFLKTHGIDMPVHSVNKKYSYSSEFEVIFKRDVEETEPAPPTPSVEEQPL